MDKIKIMTSLILIVLTMSFMVPMVLAEEDVVTATINDELDEDAGISPDSLLYGLDRTMEKIQLAFTFNNVKKSERSLRNAEERLAEVRSMIKEGKTSKAEVAEKYHKAAMENIKTSMNKMETNGDEVKTKVAYENIEKIQAKIVNHEEKVAMVKAGILERQSSSMSEEQLLHMEQVFARIQERTKDTKNVMTQQQENIRTKYKVLSGKTDAEVTESLGEELKDQGQNSEETDKGSDSNKK